MCTETAAQLLTSFDNLRLSLIRALSFFCIINKCTCTLCVFIFFFFYIFFLLLLFLLFCFVSFIQDSSGDWSPARVFFGFNFVLFYSEKAEFLFCSSSSPLFFCFFFFSTSSVYFCVRQQDPSSQWANQPTSIDIYFHLLLAMYSSTQHSCSANGDTVEI